MTALWNSFLSMDSQTLYVWAAIVAVLVFIVAELVLLELRRRSIMGHLGQFKPENPKQDEISTQTSTATGGSETGGYK